jgi:hypothetical protein
MKVVFTLHALFEMSRRDLTQEIVKNVIDQPEQSWEIREGRFLFQKCVNMESLEKEYLVRVFVDADRDQMEVVTAYKTSKIEKYWRKKS